MFDILEDLLRWKKQNKKTALVTVVHTWGSSPRPIGSKMVVTDDGGISGSVSAGCVESAVVQASQDVLQSQKSQLMQYGVTDDLAFSVGLTCGGNLQVFIRPIDWQLYSPILEAIKLNSPVVLVTIIQGPEEYLGREIAFLENGVVLGKIGNDLDEEIISIAQKLLNAGKPQTLDFPHPNDKSQNIKIFLDVLLTKPQLFIIGGGHIAIDLVRIANIMGYRTVIIDPRRAFANSERFPIADRILQLWPEEAFSKEPITSTTAIAVVAHDPKIDDPALIMALNSSAFYVGVLGSRVTHTSRRQRLLEYGLTEMQLDRLFAPIGLNISAKNPQEIALSIMSQIVQVRNS